MLVIATGHRPGGLLAPHTAIATAAGGQYLFGSLAGRGGVASLYDFENGKPLFPGVHASYKFCLLSLTGKSQPEPSARYAFFLQDTADLDDPSRVFALSPDEISLLSPNTRTLPIFRTRRDADLTAAIYRRIPILWDEAAQRGNAWGVAFKRIFHLTDDSDLLRRREELGDTGWQLQGNVFTRHGKRMLPLYEAKMVHHFDHRWNLFCDSDNDETRRLTLVEKQDPEFEPQPRYWIQDEGRIFSRRKDKDVNVPGVSERLAELGWERDWLCGWRDVCRATDERTAVPAFLPRAAVGYSFCLMFPMVSPIMVAALVATQSSLVFDYVSRQKIAGIDMTFFTWKQLPVPTPAMLEPHLDFIAPRVLELVYTAYDMIPLARDLGDECEPFRWDEDRRAQLRAELDAFFFHIYGIDDRDDVDYILGTFQTETGGLKHNEIRDHGEYRTKRLVLAEYDRMAAADAAGVPYESPLTLPPGQGPRHSPRGGAST